MKGEHRDVSCPATVMLWACDSSLLCAVHGCCALCKCVCIATAEATTIAHQIMQRRLFLHNTSSLNPHVFAQTTGRLGVLMGYWQAEGRNAQDLDSVCMAHGECGTEPS